ALPDRMDQADLQGARLTGGDEARDANGPAAAPLAADAHADAGDGEPAAGGDRNLRRAENSCILSLGRSVELQQCHVRRGAMGRHRLHTESGVNAYVFYILQLRLTIDPVINDLV